MQANTLSNPFEILLEELQGLRDDIREMKDPSSKEPPPKSSEYLKSIKEISEFVGCCMSHAQKIKNENPEIFVQLGTRKFMVAKSALLELLKKGNKKR